MKALLMITALFLALDSLSQYDKEFAEYQFYLDPDMEIDSVLIQDIQTIYINFSTINHYTGFNLNDIEEIENLQSSILNKLSIKDSDTVIIVLREGNIDLSSFVLNNIHGVRNLIIFSDGKILLRETLHSQKQKKFNLFFLRSEELEIDLHFIDKLFVIESLVILVALEGDNNFEIINKTTYVNKIHFYSKTYEDHYNLIVRILRNYKLNKIYKRFKGATILEYSPSFKFRKNSVLDYLNPIPVPVVKRVGE